MREILSRLGRRRPLAGRPADALARRAAFLGGLIALTSPSLLAQCETYVVTYPNPQDLDLFGWSVAVDASTSAYGVVGGDAGCASGTFLTSVNDLTFDATGPLTDVFGLFIVSRTPNLVSNVAGGEGSLCLGGAIGRYNAFIQSTGAAGLAILPVDLMQISTPNGTVEAVAGDAFYFQFWHRFVFTAWSSAGEVHAKAPVPLEP